MSRGGFHPLYPFSGALTDVDRIARWSATISPQAALKRAPVALVDVLRCHPRSILPRRPLPYRARRRMTAPASPCAGWLRTPDLRHKLVFGEHGALPPQLPTTTGTPETTRDRALADALTGPVSCGHALRGGKATIADRTARRPARGFFVPTSRRTTDIDTCTRPNNAAHRRRCDRYDGRYDGRPPAQPYGQRRGERVQARSKP